MTTINSTQWLSSDQAARPVHKYDVYISLPLVVAIVCGQTFNFIWYLSELSSSSDIPCLGFSLIAIVCVAFIMQHITWKYYPVRTMDSVIKLALWMSVAHEMIEMANERWSMDTNSAMVISFLHKFLLLIAMLSASHATRIAVGLFRKRAASSQ